MELKIIDYKTADLAYEAGFPQRTNECYVNDWFCPNYNHVFPEGHTIENITSAPTQELLKKWLRDNHELNIEIQSPDYGHDTWKPSIHIIGKMGSILNIKKEYESYEQALEAGLKEALKYLLK